MGKMPWAGELACRELRTTVYTLGLFSPVLILVSKEMQKLDLVACWRKAMQKLRMIALFLGDEEEEDGAAVLLRTLCEVV